MNGGQIYVIDATQDTVSFNNPAILSVTGASNMALTPDKTKTAVFGSTTNSIFVIDSQTEATSGTVGLSSAIGGGPQSMVAMPIPCVPGTNGCSSDELLIVAEPGASVAGTSLLGAVQFIDITSGTLVTTVAISQARRLVLSHDGTKLLVFGDDYGVNLVDTSARTATPITSPSFDHPVNAVFRSDDKTAYILSCGPECGGTTANVAALTISSGVVGTPTPVSAATVGIIDGANNLYVAGTGASGGLLDILNASSLTVSKSAIPIGDGYHNNMVLTTKGQLFIGARNCPDGKCMSILNTTSQTAYINPCVAGTATCPSGDVTGMLPLDNRALIYVAQGGILHIYDLTHDPPSENLTLGVPFLVLQGNIIDVKQID